MKEGHRYLPSFALPLDVQRAQSALHATLRVKHFAGFADAGRGMGFRFAGGGMEGKRSEGRQQYSR